MTTYAIPDPPPADVTMLWDDDGDQWCRVADDHPAVGEWVPHDTIDDEPHITEAALDWPSLVYEYGPLTDTAPEAL